MNEKTKAQFLIAVILIITAGFFIVTYGPTGLDTFQIGIAVFELHPALEISIIKTDFPDPVFSGGILKYFLLVNVTGNGSNVTVNDTYPGNISFISSEPPPISGNDTWFLGNLNNEVFQINITVNVSSTFTGLLYNNATVATNFTNGSTINASDNETTLVIAPPPPPPSGSGGGSSGAAAGCSRGNFTFRLDGRQRKFYTCCTEDDCQKFWNFPDNYRCQYYPPILNARVCVPIQVERPTPTGICPIERTCGPTCCPMGSLCVNSKCLKPGPVEVHPMMPPPPENYYVLSVSEVGLLWILFLLLLVLILLFVTVFLAAMDEQKKKKKHKK